jgi:MFS family permease
MQLPSNMLLARVRPSIYMPTWAALWSIISASTAAANNFQHLIAIRFFLGIAEAPFFAGAVYLLSCFYRREELALRTAILYSGLIMATAFSGLLAAGIFSGLDQVRGLAGWQWLFILEGAGCFAIALVALFVLPDFPGDKTGSARWLFNDRERWVSVDRIQRDRVSEKKIDRSVWTGLRAAVMDVKTWLFVCVPYILFHASPFPCCLLREVLYGC